MGKFFNGKVKKDRTSLIKYTIIGIGIFVIIILFIIIAVRGNGNSNSSDAELVLKKDGVTIEIYDEYPQATDFFKTIDKYDYSDSLVANYDECDNSKVGTCKVKITGTDIDPIKTKLHIVDTTPPELEVQELYLEVGETYKPEDFVSYVEDNSMTEVTILFYESDEDEYGDPIDYSSYTEDGTYKIKIYAKDENGNSTNPQETVLVIGNGVNTGTCEYGNLTIDDKQVNFPIAVIVGDEETGCALNKDLWDDATTQIPANDMYNAEYNRLKSQMTSVLKEHYPNGANIKVKPSFITVLNKSNKGLVGYGIYIKVYIGASGQQIDVDENLVMSYYLKPDGTRQYTQNKYNVEQ